MYIYTKPYTIFQQPCWWNWRRGRSVGWSIYDTRGTNPSNSLWLKNFCLSFLAKPAAPRSWIGYWGTKKHSSISIVRTRMHKSVHHSISSSLVIFGIAKLEVKIYPLHPSFTKGTLTVPFLKRWSDKTSKLGSWYIIKFTKRFETFGFHLSLTQVFLSIWSAKLCPIFLAKFSFPSPPCPSCWTEKLSHQFLQSANPPSASYSLIRGSNLIKENMV